jgi:hypothetical protein
MSYQQIELNPADLDECLQQLALEFDLDLDELTMVRRVLALFPRAATLSVEALDPDAFGALPLSDKFSFDIEADALTVFEHDWETLIDALIEMAMYLSGFSTLLGSDESWVVEFTIGAWKPVKKRLKRQLSIPVNDQPRGVVGLPPSEDEARERGAYLFRTMVSQYNRVSFQQMVMLAARDDIAVYFPPETHPKVLALYATMRRAMQDVAREIDLQDFERFNRRLLREVGRLEQLFHPSELPLPDWLPAAHLDDMAPRDQFATSAPQPDGSPPRLDNPFEAFIEQLFADEDEPE